MSRLDFIFDAFCFANKIFFWQQKLKKFVVGCAALIENIVLSSLTKSYANTDNALISKKC